MVGRRPPPPRCRLSWCLRFSSCNASTEKSPGTIIYCPALPHLPSLVLTPSSRQPPHPPPASPIPPTGPPSFLGSHTECKYALMTFGIPVSLIPLDDHGQFNMDGFSLMVDELREQEQRWIAKEKEEEAQGRILFPSVNDVLLGRGRPYRKLLTTSSKRSGLTRRNFRNCYSSLSSFVLSASTTMKNKKNNQAAVLVLRRHIYTTSFTFFRLFSLPVFCCIRLMHDV